MRQYFITVWDIDYGKYSYVMGTNDIEHVRQNLKNRYDRFTIEDTGRTL